MCRVQTAPHLFLLLGLLHRVQVVIVTTLEDPRGGEGAYPAQTAGARVTNEAVGLLGGLLSAPPSHFAPNPRGDVRTCWDDMFSCFSTALAASSAMWSDRKMTVTRQLFAGGPLSLPPPSGD